MNTTFVYGLIMAIASSLLNYALYFAGYHETAEKIQSSQTIGLVGGLAIGITCIVLAVRARKAETPLSEPFGYGRSFLAAFLTSLWGVILGTISHVVYVGLVNPGFREIALQGEIAKMEAKGVPAAQIEQAEPFIRMMMSPVAQGLFGIVVGIFIWTIISLIIAAIIRRPAAEIAPTPATPAL